MDFQIIFLYYVLRCWEVYILDQFFVFFSFVIFFTRYHKYPQVFIVFNALYETEF